MITSNAYAFKLHRMKKPDDEHSSVIDELTNALQSYNAKTEKEKSKMKDPELRRIIELQNNRISEMSEEISYFKQNNKEMEDQLEVLQEEYNELQKSFDLTIEEMDSLKEEAGNLEKDMTSHMEKEKAMDDEITELKEKINTLENELTQKLEKIKEFEDRETSSEGEVNVGELKFNYEIKISALENKLTDLKSQLSSQDTGKSQINQLEGEVKQKELKIKEEKALFDKREKENKELLDQLNGLNKKHSQEIAQLEKTIQDNSSEIEKLEKILREKDEEILKLKTAVNDVKQVKPSATPTEKFSKAKLREIIDSSKLAQNILNILEENKQIKLKFLAMQLGTSQKKCLEELKKLEDINYLLIEFSKPGDRNPNIKIIN